MPEVGEALSPLEVMAKAAFPGKGKVLDAKETMRRAILALAEVELPQVMRAGGSGIYPHERDGMYRDAFRIMLRAIANEGKE